MRKSLFQLLFRGEVRFGLKSKVLVVHENVSLGLKLNSRLKSIDSLFQFWVGEVDSSVTSVKLTFGATNKYQKQKYQHCSVIFHSQRLQNFW